jgi:flagellar basal-body rod protein FlgG
MIRAFYAASSGMVAQTIKQDVTANNIANAQTAGFKRRRVEMMSFADVIANKAAFVPASWRTSYPDSPAAPAIVIARERADQSQGAIRSTGDKLDLAIDGPGAFEVEFGSGTRLVRGGSFRLNDRRELCTADGAVLLGSAGPVRVPEGEWTITSDGAVLSNGAETDRVKLIGAQENQTKVMQGYLENSNVNIVSEMVSMIANLRSYEANQRVITSVDRTLDKLINEVGRV